MHAWVGGAARQLGPGCAAKASYIPWAGATDMLGHLSSTTELAREQRRHANVRRSLSVQHATCSCQARLALELWPSSPGPHALHHSGPCLSIATCRKGPRQRSKPIGSRNRGLEIRCLMLGRSPKLSAVKSAHSIVGRRSTHHLGLCWAPRRWALTDSSPACHRPRPWAARDCPRLPNPAASLWDPWCVTVLRSQRDRRLVQTRASPGTLF